MNAQNIRKAFVSISAIMDENRDYLIELDQQNGDGDLGISMSAGFKAASAYFSSSEEKDLGKLLMKCSGVFNESAPSSLGTIISIGFMGMAKALKGRDEVGLEEFVRAMEAGVNSIMEKAKSKPGEKTILDAFCPAIEALKSAAAKNVTGAAAFGAAAEAAARGSESTRNMKSVHGRAAYYSEQSLGILDGGSAAGKLIFEGIRASL
jgi:dihydroxyacetone kinase-like protein